jgi:hypothetical protein
MWEIPAASRCKKILGSRTLVKTLNMRTKHLRRVEGGLEKELVKIRRYPVDEKGTH